MWGGITHRSEPMRAPMSCTECSVLVLVVTGLVDRGSASNILYNSIYKLNPINAFKPRPILTPPTDVASYVPWDAIEAADERLRLAHNTEVMNAVWYRATWSDVT